MSMTTDEEVQLAMAALSVIGSIIDTVRKAHSQSLDPKLVIAQLQSLTDALAANDRQIDAQVEAKFPGKP